VVITMTYGRNDRFVGGPHRFSTFTSAGLRLYTRFVVLAL
jgi:hypothetical protein